MSRTNWRIKALTESLEILALPAESQLTWLGPKASVDELALNFDDIAGAAADMLACNEINRKQFEAIKPVDDCLDRMSGMQHAALWTPEGLRSSPEWIEVRRLAKECLRLFVEV